MASEELTEETPEIQWTKHVQRFGNVIARGEARRKQHTYKDGRVITEDLPQEDEESEPDLLTEDI